MEVTIQHAGNRQGSACEALIPNSANAGRGRDAITTSVPTHSQPFEIVFKMTITVTRELAAPLVHEGEHPIHERCVTVDTASDRNRLIVG